MSQFPETTPAVLSVSASPFQQEVCQPCLLLLVVCQLGSLMVPRSPIQPCHRCQLQWLCFTSHHHPSPCQPLSPRPSDWEWRGGNRWWSGSMVVTTYTREDFFSPSHSLFLTGWYLRLFLLTTLLLDSKLGAGEISKQSANNLISGSLKSSFAWSTDIKKQGSTPKVFAGWTHLDLHADSSSLSGICVAMARNRA